MVSLVLSFSLLSVTMYHQYSYAQQATGKIVDLYPTDDAYVVTDRYDPQGVQGLEKVNTGNLQFLKVWYAWNATKSGKQFIGSVVYLKFDLTNLKSNNIKLAFLDLTPFAMQLTSSTRELDVYTGLDNKWNESKIDYLNAPHFYINQSSTSLVGYSNLNQSVTWDLTQQVKSHTGSFLTLALLFHLNNLHNEEIVDFYSKENTDPLKRPKLELITLPETTGETSSSVTGQNNGAAFFDSGYGYVTIGIIVAAIAIGGFFIIRRKNKDSASTLDQKSAGRVQTTSGTIECPTCKKTISTDYKHCPHCGLSLDQYVKCRSCGRLSLSSIKFCTNCGKDLY